MGDLLDGNGLQVQYGRISVGVRGVAVLFVIALAIVVAANLWVGRQVEATVDRYVQATGREHRALLTALNIQACMQSFDYEERRALRRSLGGTRSSREAFDVLTSWCPWLSSSGASGGMMP